MGVVVVFAFGDEDARVDLLQRVDDKTVQYNRQIKKKIIK